MMDFLKTILDSGLTAVVLMAGFIIIPLIIVGLCKIPASRSKKFNKRLQRLIEWSLKFWFIYACICVLMFIMKLFEGLIEKLI